MDVIIENTTANSWIVLDAALLVGGTLERIVLSGKGAATKTVLGAAALVPSH